MPATAKEQVAAAELSHEQLPAVKGGALAVILERLDQAGYEVSFELYNAANFGATQIRERVVIIGKRRDLGGALPVAHLLPTHDEEGRFGLHKWRTLGELLSELNVPSSEQHFTQFPEKRLRFYRLLKESQYWKDLPQELWEEAMGAKLKLGGGKTGSYRFHRHCYKQRPLHINMRCGRCAVKTTRP